MEDSAFYEDKKFCHTCGCYPRYLWSPDDCYCITCGSSNLSMFSESDWETFFKTLGHRGSGREAHEDYHRYPDEPEF